MAPTIHLLPSLITFRCSCWLTPSALSSFINHPARRNSDGIDVCVRTVGRHYAISHIEERVAVTHNDKLSDRICVAAWCSCIMYVANVQNDAGYARAVAAVADIDGSLPLPGVTPPQKIKRISMTPLYEWTHTQRGHVCWCIELYASILCAYFSLIALLQKSTLLFGSITAGGQSSSSTMQACSNNCWWFAACAIMIFFIFIKTSGPIYLHSRV